MGMGRVRTRGAVACLAFLLAVVLPSAVASAQVSADLRQVIDNDGILTPEQLVYLAAGVNDARAATNTDIVVVVVNADDGRAPTDVAIEAAPPPTDIPRITVVLVASPQPDVTTLTSPVGATFDDLSIESAVVAAKESLATDPGAGIYGAGSVFLSELAQIDVGPTEGGGSTWEGPVGLGFLRDLMVLWAIIGIVFVGFRLITVPMKPVRLEQVGVEQAYDEIDQFLFGLYEGRFGFPSGFFMTNDKKSRPGQKLVHDEWVLKGTVLARVTRAVSAFCANTFAGVGILVALLLLACFWLYLGIWMWLAEQAAKFLLRSRITAVITPLPDSPGCEVRFRTRGPCALLLRGRIARAFQTPTLPSRFRSLAPSHSSSGTEPA